MKIIYTSSHYKNAVYRAVFSILLGLALVIWPGAAIKYVIMLIGALFLATGLISFVVSYRNRPAGSSGWTSFSGIGSIILGLLFLSIPSSFATVFMFLLGFVLLVAAIGQLVTLSAARQWGYVAPISYLFPVLILIAGIVILFDPFKSAEGIFILFGLTAIFYGVTDLINQYTVNQLRKKNEKESQEKRMDGEGDIQDTDYEEVK